ncbi:hypothetical protein HID58_048901 [Brassica napus]|uniref:Uncharacterized protein n=2 Tax=Brassica napus TaxID=3708 RepID=A0ABQ8B4F4_BRANA|nr:hypothetical protein HID58_048901 [Brassica napus]
MLSILCRPLSASVSWNPVRSFVLAFNSVSPIFQDLKVCDNRCLAVAELALPEDKEKPIELGENLEERKEKRELLLFVSEIEDIVDQKASLDGTDNEQQQLGELSNPPLDMKSVDPSLWEVEDAEDDQDQELDDYNKIPYDAEWIAKTNCVEYPATIDVKEDNKEEDNAKEDEEEDDDSGAEEDEEYVVDEESSEEDEEDDDAKEDDDSDAEKDEDYEVDEEEDDDSGSEEDEEIQQPLRRSSRIKNVK